MQALIKLVQFLLMASGTLFLGVESYEVIANNDLEFSWVYFWVGSAALSIILWIAHGLVFDGYMRGRISITSNIIDGSINIMFGDLLKQKGWKVIGVNDFFDSQVDDVLISSNTLHGKVLNEYWGAAKATWDATISTELSDIGHTTDNVHVGKNKRYPVGTTARAVSNDGTKFLFVALGRTQLGDRTTQANAEDIITAVRGLLRKARACCSNDPLCIPLLGSGLARTGIKEHLLLQLIIIAIIEEIKISKITSSINIILPANLRHKINIGSINTHWK